MSAFDKAWSLLKSDPQLPKTPSYNPMVDEFIERGFNPTYGPNMKVMDTVESMMNRFRDRYNMDMETPEKMLAYLDSLQEQEGWEQ
jgi:hypothetical protein